jgi:DNA-binding NarL/FixJ family response regulator
MLSIRLVLVDDHAHVRRAIRNMLEAQADLQVVGEASNGSDALLMVEHLAPDLLLLDVEMPGVSGADVARRLQADGSPVKILAVSAYDDLHLIKAMLENGAAGYLTKDEVPELLLPAVRGVARGERGWFSRRAASQVNELAENEEADSQEEEEDADAASQFAAGIA